MSVVIFSFEGKGRLGGVARLCDEIGHALRRAGYDVLEAASGPEALKLANGTTPVDLLLTDVVLKGMGGRELAEQFARSYPSARVLFTSGYPDDVTAGRGVPRGAVAFLPKPYSPDALVSRVSDALAAPAPIRTIPEPS